VKTRKFWPQSYNELGPAKRYRVRYNMLLRGLEPIKISIALRSVRRGEPRIMHVGRLVTELAQTI